MFQLPVSKMTNTDTCVQCIYIPLLFLYIYVLSQVSVSLIILFKLTGNSLLCNKLLSRNASLLWKKG